MRTCFCLAFVLLLLPPRASSQRSFSDSSRLKDAAYVKGRIHEISDGDLWRSIDLDSPGLELARKAVARGNYEEAAGAWGEFWNTRRRPVYITRTDHLYLDTDMLTDTASFRADLEASPAERDTILARAGMMLRNAIRPWGDTVLYFGSRVDFNSEVGATGKYGFHYWMWSRPLLMAYVLTGDQRYLAKFDDLFNTWYEQRNSISSSIPGLDVVYYELGLGMRNRMFIEYYSFPYRNRPARTHERMLKTALAAGRWLYELERWEGYRPGNWQTHGSYMLVQLALVFPRFREAAAWLEIGLRRLSEHLAEDFTSDGAHSERAPRNYTLATYLNYRNLAYLLGRYDAAPDVRERIRASLGRTIDWWITMIAPTGEVPAINDSHRGLFPASVLRDGARLFDRPEAYAILRGLLGQRGDPPGPLPSYTSRHMPASGFTIMRSDWTPGALYLSVNYGPAAGFHTHFDMLDFEIYAYGKALAVDAGLGLTYDDPLYESWYRSSRAHNMVAVNDSNIEREGIRGEDIRWSTSPGLDYFSGTHRGYRRFGTRVTREIAFVKPVYWFMLDHIACGRAGDTLSWYLHTPESVVRSGAGFASASSPGIRILPAGEHYAVRTGQGWAASTHVRLPGRTEEIPWIRFDQTGSRDTVREFAILLAPFSDGERPPLPGTFSDRHFTVTRGDTTDHLYFTRGKYRDASLSTDAAFLLVRFIRGAPSHYSVINGTSFVWKGRSVFSAANPESAEGVLSP